MKILILSFYYPPDLSAGSFRVFGLVKALRGVIGRDIQIEVITTQPNRYHGFGEVADAEENSVDLKIHRIKIPEHNSGMLDQAKSFVFYAHGVKKIIKNQKYDFVFSTSSRLMTAALGAWISRSKKIPLYLDIRDIFLDTIQSILPKKSTQFLTPIFSAIERFTISQATHINLVSRGFEGYFRGRYPKKSFSYYTNGIDEEFLSEDLKVEKVARSNQSSITPMHILYAGNVGEGQGLHKIIPILAQKLGGRVRIKLIGGGGRLQQLQSALSLMNVDNVEVSSPMARRDLMREYRAADILFLHLNDYKAFEKVLPSKIFEYAALGKPILAGVSGYAAQFISEEVSNSAIFSPCDVDGAIKAFECLSIEYTNRENFIDKYSRKNIMKLLAEDILSRFESKK